MALSGQAHFIAHLLQGIQEIVSWAFFLLTQWRSAIHLPPAQKHNNVSQGQAHAVLRAVFLQQDKRMNPPTDRAAGVESVHVAQFLRRAKKQKFVRAPEGCPCPRQEKSINSPPDRAAGVESVHVAQFPTRAKNSDSSEHTFG